MAAIRVERKDVIKGNERNKAVIRKKTVTKTNVQQSEEHNTIKKGGNTSVSAVCTVDTFYMVYTVHMV